MIEYAGAIFLVIGFVVILKVFRLVDKANRVIAISRQSVADLRSAEMDDDAKEVAMQSHAKQLFGLFFLLTIGGVAAIFLPLAVIWGLDRIGLVSLDGVLAVALGWPFIIATTIVLFVVLFLKRKQ